MATATIKFGAGDFEVTAEVRREGAQWLAAWAGITGTGYTAADSLMSLQVLIRTSPAEEVADALEK